MIVYLFNVKNLKKGCLFLTKKNNIISFTTMQMIKFQPDQIKNQRINSGTCTQGGSPSAQSTLMSASEAFALSDLVDPKNFEIQNQIDSMSQDQVDKIQQKKHKDQIQQHILLDLHHELGNKWTDIASRLSGWDHNSIKNYFYAKIRKSLRRIGFFTKKFLSEKIKPLNMCHVSKMITTLSEKNSEDPFILSKQEEIQLVKKFLFDMSQRTQEDLLNQAQLKYMQININKIVSLIDYVKKNCTLNKKNKKKNEKNLQKTGNCIRESTTIKAAKVQPQHQIKIQEGINFNIFQPQASQKVNENPQTYWIMFMPCQQLQLNENFINYQPSSFNWVNLPHHYGIMDVNIFGTS